MAYLDNQDRPYSSPCDVNQWNKRNSAGDDMRRDRKRFRSPKSRLAGYNERGKIWLNPKVPRRYRASLRKHEEAEIKYRRMGYSYEAAHRMALKEEHKGMTRHQIAVYEGKLGAIAKESKRR